MEVKRELSVELASVVKRALKEDLGEQEILSSDAVTHICNVTEAIFIHGLKHMYFLNARNAKYPEPNFWPFIYKFTHRNVRTQLGGLSQIKNDIGKARAWIRLALTETVLENYLAAFARERSTVRTYYHKWAYLLDTEQSEVFSNYMRAMSRLKIKAPINSRLLNEWTPTPLRLSGLLNARQPTPGVTVDMDSMGGVSIGGEEDPEVMVGVSALDFFNPEGEDSSEGSTTSSVPPPSSRAGRIFSDEESWAGSVGSHPSIADAKFRAIMQDLQKSGGSSSGTPGPTFDEHDLHDSGIGSSTDPNNGAPGSNQVVVRRGGTQNSKIAHSRSGKSLRKDTPSPKTQVTGSKSSNHDDQHLPHLAAKSPISPPIPDTEQNNSNTNHEEPSSPTSKTLAPRIRSPISDDDGQSESLLFKSAIADESFKSAAEKSAVEKSADGPAGSADGPTESADKTAESADQSIQSDFDVQNRTGTENYNELLDSLSSSYPRSPSLHAELNEAEQTRNRNHTKTLDSEERDRRSRNKSESQATELPSSPGFGNSLLGRNQWSTSLEASYDDSGKSRCSGRTSTGSSLLGLGDSMLRSESGEPPTSFGQLLTKTLQKYDTATDPVRQVVEKEVGEGDMEKSFVDGMNEGETEIGIALGDTHSPTQDSPTNGYVIIKGEDLRDDYPDPHDRSLLLCRLAGEGGLDHQNYTCRSCRRPIGLVYGPFRVCAFDGCYYCKDCHRNDEAHVPAKIMLNWDLQPKKVSRASKGFLDHMADRAVLNMDQISSSLYDAVDEMKEVYGLRRQLSFLAPYLMTCKESVAEDLRKRLWPKEYFYTDIHLFSINDLINASTGVLQKHLRSVISYAMGHVTECRLCSQKGFVCECGKLPCIFPFQVETTTRCEKCFSVFHKECISNRPCPKCQRRELYYKQRRDTEGAEGSSPQPNLDLHGLDDH